MATNIELLIIRPFPSICVVASALWGGCFVRLTLPRRRSIWEENDRQRGSGLHIPIHAQHTQSGSLFADGKSDRSLRRSPKGQ
jgi:hypothetical protein